MPPKKRIHINKTWFILFELCGLGLSIFLFLVSASIVNLPCPRDSIFACTGVVRGAFGHVGPFSVAAMGVVYFICHLMLSVGLRERAAQLTKGLLVFGGLIFVAWLRALEIIYIREICPWCWGVALVTLIHAGITYTIMAPPLPKLRPGGIAGVVFGGFIVLIGLVSLVELTLRPGEWMQKFDRPTEAHSPAPESTAPIATPGDDEDDAKPKPKKNTPVKKATPQPKTTSTPGPTPGTTVQVSPSPTPAPTATPSSSPTPAATPAPSLAFDPEPQLQPSQDVTVLKRRGWRHAASGDSVVKAVKIQPPVLMLAYDPHCPDCHRLITQTLDNDIMNGLRVTRIAIQESMLNGQVNAMVTELPTLILFAEDGRQLLKQVGSRITAEELAAKINAELQK